MGYALMTERTFSMPIGHFDHHEFMSAMDELIKTLKTIGRNYATVHNLCPQCGEKMVEGRCEGNAVRVCPACEHVQE